eukprot:scaffold272919_cov49-Prasinocladus_malaysianus.AAC.1
MRTRWTAQLAKEQAVVSGLLPNRIANRNAVTHAACLFSAPSRKSSQLQELRRLQMALATAVSTLGAANADTGPASTKEMSKQRKVCPRIEMKGQISLTMATPGRLKLAQLKCIKRHNTRHKLAHGFTGLAHLHHARVLEATKETTEAKSERAGEGAAAMEGWYQLLEDCKDPMVSEAYDVPRPYPQPSGAGSDLASALQDMIQLENAEHLDQIRALTEMIWHVGQQREHKAIPRQPKPGRSYHSAPDAGRPVFSAATMESRAFSVPHYPMLH